MADEKTKEEPKAAKAPRVKFIGDPADNFSGPTYMIWKGQQFKKNQYRELDPKLVEKARTHNHFVVEGEPDPTVEDKAPVERTRDKAWTVKELRQVLTDRGVVFDKKAGAEALLAVVEDNGGLPE